MANKDPLFNLALLEARIAKRIARGVPKQQREQAVAKYREETAAAGGPWQRDHWAQYRRASALADQKRKANGAWNKGGWRIDGVKTSRGVVSAQSRWVGLIRAMEPGRWYGSGVLRQMSEAGGTCIPNSQRFKLFTDRGLNPNRVPQIKHWAGSAEPTYLFRLNRWGKALNAQLNQQLDQDRVDVFKLDGARPELWVRLRKSPPGLVPRGTVPGRRRFGGNGSKLWKLKRGLETES